MEYLIGIGMGLLFLFIYRLGYSDGARNNVKSPIKVVKDAVNDVINHKEIKEKTEKDKGYEKAFQDVLNCSQDSMLKFIQNEVNNT